MLETTTPEELGRCTIQQAHDRFRLLFIAHHMASGEVKVEYGRLLAALKELLGREERTYGAWEDQIIADLEAQLRTLRNYCGAVA